MSDLLYFINERMRILMVIKEHQIEIDDILVCPLNQEEIAKLVPCSKQKVNLTIKELVSAGYIEMMRSKGRYYISKKGELALEKILCKWVRR